MIIRSKAPLRIGLAGGGSDVAPYSDLHGGAILNATINLFAYSSIEPGTDGKITFELADKKMLKSFDTQESLPTNHAFSLHAGIYNRIIRNLSCSRYPSN